MTRAEKHGLLQRALSVLRQPKGETTIPLRKQSLLPFSELCVQTKAKVRLLSAHKVYECAHGESSSSQRRLVIETR